MMPSAFRGIFYALKGGKDTRMARASKAVRLPDTQHGAGTQNQAADPQANPAVTVYDGGITEEIVHGYLPTTLNFLFSRNWGSYPLKDGRYVYEEWVRRGKRLYLIKKAYSGLAPDILAYLTETDRKENNAQRVAKEHTDYSVRLEDGGEDEDGYYYQQSAISRASYQRWVWEETRDAAVDDPIYPNDRLKQDFVSGENRVNNQRWLMRHQVVEQFISNLSLNDRETIARYYGMGMTEKQIGTEDGVNKQAVCNRISRIEEDLRKVFTLLGIPCSTKGGLKKEAAKAAVRQRAMKEAERERVADEAEIRAINVAVRSENRTDIAGKIPKNTLCGNGDAFLSDYDPDNPEDYVSDDYDPYEDPRYKEAIAEAEAEYAELWDDNEVGGGVDDGDTDVDSEVSGEDCCVEYYTDADYEE